MNMMKNDNEEKKALEQMEVEVYGITDCGQLRYDCLNDCIGGGAFLSTTE